MQQNTVTAVRPLDYIKILRQKLQNAGGTILGKKLRHQNVVT